ncbi:hypothetical protein P355_3758 [Burkholderia cenocepacia KC-01]|nr:hypothetical protein P355_3758 [Burkholderia cenocepacia KC-01]
MRLEHRAIVFVIHGHAPIQKKTHSVDGGEWADRLPGPRSARAWQGCRDCRDGGPRPVTCFQLMRPAFARDAQVPPYE